LLSDDSLLQKIDGYFSLLKICFSWFSVAKAVVGNDDHWQQVKDQLSPDQLLDLTVRSKVKSLSRAVFAGELLLNDSVIQQLLSNQNSKGVGLGKIANHYLRITSSIIKLLKTSNDAHDIQLFKMGIRALHVSVFIISKMRYGNVKRFADMSMSCWVQLMRLNKQFKFDENALSVSSLKYSVRSRSNILRRQAISQKNNALLLSIVSKTDRFFQQDDNNGTLQTEELRELALQVMNQEDVLEFDYARQVRANRPKLPDYKSAGLSNDDPEAASSSNAGNSP